ncbi:hypothetical protein QE152_g12949 [Popillia japonica]|uniref:DUF7044 domain-containing protein n=1 Tax=Popillia japonica TaxID=7064 RepID=A0AAW1LGH8_POPJA
MLKYLHFILGFYLLACIAESNADCEIPITLRGRWFSWEKRNVITEIDANSMSLRGYCVDIKDDYHQNYTIIFGQNRCYTCVKFLIRTVNVLDKIEKTCMNIAEGEEVSIERVCKNVEQDQSLTTLFAENYTPVNCRSSIEGMYNFA